MDVAVVSANDASITNRTRDPGQGHKNNRVIVGDLHYDFYLYMVFKFVVAFYFVTF